MLFGTQASNQSKQHVFNILIALLLVLVCVSAAPVRRDDDDDDDHNHYSDHDGFSREYVDQALSVIQVVVFSYATHAATIRRDPTSLWKPSLIRRWMAFAWPTSGVYEACSAIRRVFDRDRIIGTQTYAAKRLTELPPERAKKIRNCILNNNVFLGYDISLQNNYRKLSTLNLKTEDMMICGPGANKKYQILLRPSIIEFLPQKVLDDLFDYGAAGIQTQPDFPKIITTVIQIGYSAYEIIRGKGDSWAKLMLGVYLVMSILQIISQLVLPLQQVAYSVRCTVDKLDEDEICDICKHLPHPLVAGMTCKDHHTWLVTHHLQYLALRKCGVDKDEAFKLIHHMPISALFSQPPRRWRVLFTLIAPMLPLLVAIGAGYWKNSAVEGVVLTWIVLGIPASFTLVVYEPVVVNSWIIFSGIVVTILIPGTILVIVATVLGFCDASSLSPYHNRHIVSN